MGEFIIEFLISFFQEAIPSIIKLFGALIRWIFYLGRKKLSTLLKEEWNKRVGFVSLVIIIVVVIDLST